MPQRQFDDPGYAATGSLFFPDYWAPDAEQRDILYDTLGLDTAVAAVRQDAGGGGAGCCAGARQVLCVCSRARVCVGCFNNPPKKQAAPSARACGRQPPTRAAPHHHQ